MLFNERLKDVRIEKGMTQKQVCTILNISTNGYASWEQGRTQPSIESLISLCKIFDVTSDFLIGLENEDGSKFTISSSVASGTNSSFATK